MGLRAVDVVPISEARARLTELAEDVVGRGHEKLLTKNGVSYVALVDARRLDYYHALEAEHGAWCWSMTRWQAWMIWRRAGAGRGGARPGVGRTAYRTLSDHDPAG